MRPQECVAVHAASQAQPIDDEVLLTSAQTRVWLGNVSNMCLWQMDARPAGAISRARRRHQRPAILVHEDDPTLQSGAGDEGRLNEKPPDTGGRHHGDLDLAGQRNNQFHRSTCRPRIQRWSHAVCCGPRSSS